METVPTDRDVGAEIRGLNIAEPLASDDLAAVENAFVEHQVLLFRDRPLTPQQLASFSAQFGHLQRHIQKKYWHPDVPEIVFNRNVDDDGKFDDLAARRGVTEDLRTGWHSDTTYDEVPAKATAVHALEVPSQGGNTCFASAHRAYDLLPEAMRRRVADLRVEFQLGNNPRNKTANFLGSNLTDEDKARDTVSHPVICALEVPSQGGNTCFASAHRAYDLLPEAMRRRVADLRVEFQLGNNPRNKTANFLGSNLTDEDKARDTVSHPVICQHPVSKKPAIYANPLIALRIQGVSDGESDEILETLYDCLHEAGADDYRWEQDWRVGDTIIWENRGGLMHTGRLDYPPGERRIMIRCTIGSSPIEAYRG